MTKKIQDDGDGDNDDVDEQQLFFAASLVHYAPAEPWPAAGLAAGRAHRQQAYTRLDLDLVFFEIKKILKKFEITKIL
jgi:hypothetical protein